MDESYLFQFDCAPENDSFFVSGTASPHVFYRGIKFKIGPWEPDGVRVDLNRQQSGRSTLTLIELESDKSEALKSARKYLPEDPESILDAFLSYLQRVIQGCRSTADARQSALSDLEKALRQSRVEIRTAGAFRSASWTEPMQENLTVIGKSGFCVHEIVAREQDLQVEPASPKVSFRGTSVRLDQQRAKILCRCLLVLDAKIRGVDHSNARYRSYRIKAPLKTWLRERGSESPELVRLVCRDTPNSGLTLDCEALLREIVELWSKSDSAIDVEQAHQLICTYFPKAVLVKQTESMGEVFSKVGEVRASGANPQV